MKISELEQRVSLVEVVSEEYDLQSIGKSYRVNPCPLCGHKDHFTIDPDKNMWSTFANCHSDVRGGSVYKYLLTVKEMSEDDARARLHDLAGVEQEADSFDIVENVPGESLKEKEAPAVERPQEQIIYTNYVNELYQKQSKKDREYFTETRGIHPQLVSEYKLSVFKYKDGKRAMLPVWRNGEVIYYTMRALDGQKVKYLNAEGSAQASNMDYMKQAHDEPIFITEGYFDALALESRGFKAISINSTSNIDFIKSELKRNNQHNNLLISAFDNDAAGKKAAESSGLDQIKIPKEYNDIAEWGVAEIELAKESRLEQSMKDNLIAQIERVRQPDNVADYLETSFYDEIEHMAKSKNRKTGFKSLDDKMGGLYNGLYVFGGGSGVGKTTLTHQIGDNLAEQGEHVLFFSLEQSKMEIVSKSLSRQTAKTNLNDAVTSLQIRKGRNDETVTDAIEVYSKVARRMNILEGNLSTSTATIREKVQTYQKRNNVAPVVIVDYLQILQAPEDTFNMNDKKRIDDSVSELKRISRDLGIAVIVISSFNRTNYYSPVGFDSFKESGGIEYTADVVLGLQYEVMNEEPFLSEKKLGEKRTKLAEAKAESPRQVELVCLKNRFGTDYRQSFSYFAKHDYFEENQTGHDYSYIISDNINHSSKPAKHKYREIDHGDGVKEIKSVWD